MSQAVVEMTARYRQEGFVLLKTWEGRMEAVVNGAVDWDDVEPLVSECAAIAARVDDRWAECVEPLVHDLADLQAGDIDTPRDVVRMGRMADFVEAANSLVHYLWRDERRHYAECQSGGRERADHAFLTLCTLRNLINGTSHTPEDYLTDE